MPSRTLRDDRLIADTQGLAPPRQSSSVSQAVGTSAEGKKKQANTTMKVAKRTAATNTTVTTSAKAGSKTTETKTKTPAAKSNYASDGVMRAVTQTPKKTAVRAKSLSAADGNTKSVVQTATPRRESVVAPSTSASTKAVAQSKKPKGTIRPDPPAKNSVVRTRSAPVAASNPTKKPAKTATKTRSSTTTTMVTQKMGTQANTTTGKTVAKTASVEKASGSLTQTPASSKAVTARSTKVVTTKPKSMSSLDTKPSATKPSPKTRPSTGAKPATKASTKKIPTVAKLRSPQPTSRASVGQKLAAQESEILAKKSARTSSSSSPRADLSQKLAAKEAGVIAKTRRGTSSSSPPREDEQKPGAYLVQGGNVARAHGGILSPQDLAYKQEASQESTFRSIAPAKIPDSNIVVAAELSTDVEAQIEEEVRRRIIGEAVRADVVSVVHGTRFSDPKEEARRIADLKELHKPRGVKEKLFGDARNPDIDISASPESIRKRDYLKWTVKRNTATNLWVVSTQTNQKAIDNSHHIEIERSTVSFSATTQQEAFENGLANATPLMLSFEENPRCYVCKAKFALFRRPCHCRNCGVCVCSSCSTTWPAKMLPETYTAKNVTLVNICQACDWLANSFRDALVDGNYKRALRLHATGNVNVRSPFCLDKKAEVM
jgi:hypothetical protein